MTVGEGIFYGLVFLGVIYLYIQTKDRWNWKKIVFRFFGGLIGLVLIAVIADYIFDNFSINSFKENHKPKIISEMNGIELGVKLSDVIFKTGAIRDKKHADRYNFPLDENKSFFIDSQSKLVKGIGYWCTQDEVKYPNSYKSLELNGVRCGESEFTIKLNYGKENIRVLCRKKKENINEPEPEMVRRYDATEFGVSYLLVTNKVYGMYVYYPDDLKKFSSDNWVECSN